MEIVVAGLAQNFAALRSLIYLESKSHMKMHLLNILNQQNATVDQKKKPCNFLMAARLLTVQ